ncbi:MAG: flagellar export chaperone FliS [Treponemataceae bacterium]|nr:MAG: flagellar export chaperone FliS [Treponemataceae bacterium]
MGYTEAYTAYRETGVKTAGKGRLIVMLYDGAIKALTAAWERIADDGKVELYDVDKFNTSCLRAQEIITELMVSLDMRDGGEIAENLMALYIFFNQELLHANIHRDKQKITFVLEMMSQLRESWEIAANTAVVTGADRVFSTVDISG